MQPRTSHRLGLLAIFAALLVAGALAFVTASRREKNPNRNVIPYGRVELKPLTEQQVREQCLGMVGGELAPPGSLKIELAQPGPGRVNGAVVYRGEPKPAPQAGCGRKALVDGGPAEGVMVWAAGLRGFEPLTGKLLFDLKDCGLDPAIRGVAASSRLEFVNDRDAAQTVTATTPAGEERVRVEAPAKGSVPFAVREHGLHRIEAGGSQVGWLLALEHAIAAVSDGAGQVVVNGAPPGIYTLCYWHEQVGVGGGTVDVQ